MIYNERNSIGEDEIIRLLHEDNEKALEIIFKRHHAALFYFATHLINNSQAAEDIVAISFIKVWQKRKDFDSLTAIRSFQYITIRNACFNELKQSHRHSDCQEEIGYLSEKSEEIFTDQNIVRAELLRKILNEDRKSVV